jgi:O-antigen/teichoic acid export membrane protein
MLKYFKKIDPFSRNIIFVFLGSSLASFFNLLYQLLIAHSVSPLDFAAFNALLALYTIISSPLSTFQLTVVKYCSQFNASGQSAKLKFFLTDLFKKALILALLTAVIFGLASARLVSALKIPSLASGYILVLLIASTWLNPVFTGGIQGVEYFGWFVSGSLISSVFKLGFAFLFIAIGYKVSGALGALLIANIIGLVFFYFPLRRLFAISDVKRELINYKEVLLYWMPVILSTFCYVNLINMDMVLVKYYFSASESGMYSLAQLVGKIFLFLPMAINVVMFPRSSGLNARNMDSMDTLRKSLLWALFLCLCIITCYNFFPAFALKLLTGKTFAESILLGRYFSLSMSLFAISSIFISYFLSIGDFRFIKYLAIFTVVQFLAIVLFHGSILQVQLILCLVSVSVFLLHLALAITKGLRLFPRQ